MWPRDVLLTELRAGAEWYEFGKEGRSFRVAWLKRGIRVLQERITPKRRKAYWRDVPQHGFPWKWTAERILQGITKPSARVS